MVRRRGHGRRRTPTIERAAKPISTVAPQLLDTGIQTPAHSVRDSLARLLDSPQLARVVPHLAPETLHQLIRHYGLDACRELVASATPAQLTSVFDLDLWRSARPGHDERFDADRFGEWLELLIDTGPALAARTIAAMGDHLVIAGLTQHVRVYDLAAMAPGAATDDEAPGLEATAAGGLECEVGGYLVRAFDSSAWDAIVTLLAALDADHPACFHTVMRGCRRLSNSTPEVDGLDDLLVAPEQLMYEVAVDRELRRSQRGYSTPADARAFLRMAREGRGPEPASRINPIAAAYFRAADEAAAFKKREDAGPRERLRAAPSTHAAVSEAFDAVVDLFAEADLVPQPPRALLEGAQPQRSDLTVIRPLMECVRDGDADAYFRRGLELAFLANALVAGCSVQARSLTPQEGSDAAIGICNLGLEHWPARWPETKVAGAPPAGGPGATPPRAFLVDHDLVSAFEVGWAVLHQEVCMFAAGQLLAAVTDLRCADPHIQDGVQALRRELRKQCDAGTPWRACEALDVLAMLDMPVWLTLLGLMNECPVMPAALTATLEGRTGAISATAFEFISTTSQIGAIQRFMARLPEMLRS